MNARPEHQIVPTLAGDWLGGEVMSLIGMPGAAGATHPQPGGRASGSRNVAQCALRPEPCAVKAARQFTRVTLCSFGTAELFADAAVVVSELVTNAVRYGLHPGTTWAAQDAQIEVVLLRWPGHLVCVVIDANPRSPVLMEPDYAAETGRGLHVVAALSSRWGWTPLCAGRKAVWAALSLSGAGR